MCAPESQNKETPHVSPLRHWVHSPCIGPVVFISWGKPPYPILRKKSRGKKSPAAFGFRFHYVVSNDGRVTLSRVWLLKLKKEAREEFRAGLPFWASPPSRRPRKKKPQEHEAPISSSRGGWARRDCSVTLEASEPKVPARLFCAVAVIGRPPRPCRHTSVADRPKDWLAGSKRPPRSAPRCFFLSSPTRRTRLSRMGGTSLGQGYPGVGDRPVGMVKFVDSDPSGLPLKRKQVAQACVACRRRKVGSNTLRSAKRMIYLRTY